MISRISVNAPFKFGLSFGPGRLIRCAGFGHILLDESVLQMKGDFIKDKGTDVM